MTECLKIHICESCGIRLLFVSDVCDHTKATGHDDFSTMDLDTFPTILHIEDVEDIANFTPDVLILQRILEVLLDEEMERTDLAQAAGFNYGRLIRYLKWLEAKGYVVWITKEDMTARLTEQGRVLAFKLLDLRIKRPHSSRRFYQ